MRCSAKCASAVAVAAACCFGAAGASAQELESERGVTVRVGPDHGGDGSNVEVDAPGARVVVRGNQPGEPAPTYWIGLSGGEVSVELRTHLGLKDGGVIVREIAPGSPAEKAGLQQHDILLRANGRPVTDLKVLVEEVALVGPSRGQVTLDLVRAGKQETLWVKPIERPADAGVRQPRFQPQPGDPRGGVFGFDAGNPFRFRMFGPGVQVNGPNVQMQQQMNGVSVSVSKANGEASVVVKRGDEEWRLDGDDPEQLAQLPDDVRPMVERMLAGGGVRVNVDMEDLLRGMPQLEGLFGEMERPFADRRLERRIERMQRELERLQQRLDGRRPAAEPAAPLDEAPAFNGPGAEAPAPEVPES